MRIASRQQELNISNDMFFYLVQGEEPLDPIAFSEELEDIKAEFPYGYELGGYSACEDGTYNMTFFAYTSPDDFKADFHLDYYWAFTHEQLQVQLLSSSKAIYRWFDIDNKRIKSGPYEVDIISMQGNKCFYTKKGSLIFFKTLQCV